MQSAYYCGSSNTKPRIPMFEIEVRMVTDKKVEQAMKNQEDIHTDKDIFGAARNEK